MRSRVCSKPAFASRGLAVVLSSVLLSVVSSAAWGAVVFQENFDDGPRPRGNKGDVRTVFANDSIGDYWVQYPGNSSVLWFAPDESANTWNFGGQSSDPLEPPLPGQTAPNPFNGMAYGKGTASASARFLADVSASYSLNATILAPNNYLGNPNPGADLINLGFASSNALADNLGSNGVAWVTLRSTGVFELHTPTGMASQQLLGFGPTGGSLVHLTLTYDRAAGQLIADTDLGTSLVLPLASFNPQYVGMDVRTPTHEGLLATVSHIQIINEVPEPAGMTLLLVAGALLGRRRR